MVVGFATRRTAEGDGEEYSTGSAMSELARKMPGYISHKGYVAHDGDRLTRSKGSHGHTEWGATHSRNILPVKSSAGRNFTLNIICKFASWCANRDSGVIPDRIKGACGLSSPAQRCRSPTV